MVILQNFCVKFGDGKILIKLKRNYLQFPVYSSLSKNKEMTLYLEVLTTIEGTRYLGLLSKYLV